MPGLESKLHLNMLAGAQKRGETDGQPYGMHWGDPKKDAHLAFVRDRWCAPYVSPTSTVLEIGPGGGRWTRYLLGCEKLYAVDYHEELLIELQKNYDVNHLELVLNNGTDFPGVEDESIDFLFSFGVFVHLDLPLIDGYLKEIYRVLRQDGDVVIQYSDKSKPAADINEGFSANTPSKMRRMIIDHGFLILEENLTILPHSALVRFTRSDENPLLKSQTYTQA